MRNWPLVLVFFLLIACAKDSEQVEPASGVELHLPDLPYAYTDIFLPEHITSDPTLNFFDNSPSSNPLTDAGATLGRVLFYDKLLSRDNSVSCSSCHHQANAFADTRVLSPGIDGQMGTRNSMNLVNLRYFGRFFWDNRVNTIEQQVLMPIEDHTEMDQDLDALSAKLAASSYYPGLFAAAFGDSTVNSQRISRALAQFLRSITSFQSRYDLGVANDYADFTALESAGRELFFSGDIKCNHCHTSQNFMSRAEPMMNGLESLVVDSGFYNATGNPENVGEFKVVSLRNIGVTAPYMHDGRFATLDEVLDHYSEGVQSHPNLNDRITADGQTGGAPFQAALTDDEKLALKAFLLTLTDQEVLTNERWSDPFE